jgi:UPF0755 protein
MGRLIKTLIALSIPLFIGAVTFFYLRGYLEPVDSNNQEIVYFEVLPDQSFRSIARKLEVEGLIQHWRVVDVLSRMRGEDTKIKAGEYELFPAMSAKEIIAKLASGEIYRRVVVVKEGVSVWEIGSILQSAGLNAAAEFNDAMRNFEFLREAGIRAENFEGYLFPDTYYFSKSDSIRSIIWRMLERGDQLWDIQAMKQAEKLRMTRHEILTLASIIEKESGNVKEQNRVSSVFHNRLGHGMKLQSDPTVVYGIPDYRGVITHEMLLRVHPYNTYINFGLPPGPICNPGETAIKAALNPADTRFLYFVADGKGGHVFSKNLDEHNQAVQRYRSAMKAAAAPVVVAPEAEAKNKAAAGAVPAEAGAEGVAAPAVTAANPNQIQAPVAKSIEPSVVAPQPVVVEPKVVAPQVNPQVGASVTTSGKTAIQ